MWASSSITPSLMKILGLLVTSWVISTSLAQTQLDELPDVVFNRWVSNSYPKVRPRLNASESLEVSIIILLNQILEVNIQYGTLSVNMELLMSWYDEFLPLSNVTIEAMMTLPAELVWTPDITILASADTVSKKDWLDAMSVLVFTDPETELMRVMWPVHVVATIQCPMDITWFPFDVQLCHINLGSMNVPVQYLDFNRSFLPDSDDLPENHEFLVENMGVTYNTSNADTAGFAVMTQSIQLTRKSMYYIVNIIVPCIILSLLAVFALLLPTECGEKISLQVTILLAYVVFLLLVSDITPPTSSIPILTIYITSVMANCALSLMATIIVERMHNASGKWRVPRPLRYILLDLCGCDLLRQLEISRAETATRSVDAGIHLKSMNGEEFPVERGTPGSNSGRSGSGRKHATDNAHERDDETDNGTDARTHNTTNSDLTDKATTQLNSNNRTKSELLLTEIATSIQKMNIILTKLVEEPDKSPSEQPDRNQKEWRACAKIVDRIFAVINFISFLLITVLCASFAIP